MRPIDAPPLPPSLSSINILAPPICNSGTQTPSSLLHLATTRSPVPHPFWCVQPNSVLATLRPPNSSPFYNHRHDTTLILSYCHTLCHSTPIAPCMQPHVELNPQSDLPTLHFCLSLSSPHGWPLAVHASRRVSLHSIRSRPSTARARRVSGQLTARVASRVDFSTRLSLQTTRSNHSRSHRRVPGPSSWRQTCSATCWPH